MGDARPGPDARPEPFSLPMAECRLDEAGLSAQRDRYRELARHLERIERHPGRLEAHFAQELDLALLQETIEVERECCTFLSIDFDPRRRRLSIGVDDLAQDPALDALQYALS